MAKLNTRLTDANRKDFTSTAINLLSRRRRLVRPQWDALDNDGYAIFRAALPPDVNAAVTLLSDKLEGKFSPMLESCDEVVIRVYDVEPKMAVKFTWNKYRPCIKRGWGEDSYLDISSKHPLAASLLDFGAKCKAIDEQNNLVYTLVRDVVKQCGTFGQIHRVWPDLLPLVSSEKISAAEKQQRKSSLPYGLDIETVIAHRDEFTGYLAQAAVLPRNYTPKIWVN